MNPHTIIPPVQSPAAAPSLDTSRSINDTVLAYPNALPIFAAHGLDTCCRGALSIQDAAHQAGVNMDQLTEELNRLISPRPQ